MKNKDSVWVCGCVWDRMKEWGWDKQCILERDRGVYGVKYRVVRDKKLWMGYEKVMKRERQKTPWKVWQSDQQTQAFPQPLYRVSVDCELIHGAGPQTVKVMGTGCQITAQREIIMGINQYLTHCCKYVAALQGRGLCKNQSTGFRERPKMQCCVSHRVQMQNTGGCAIPKSDNQVRVGVCKIAAEHKEV